jgi:hypothetical protein
VNRTEVKIMKRLSVVFLALCLVAVSAKSLEKRDDIGSGESGEESGFLEEVDDFGTLLGDTLEELLEGSGEEEDLSGDDELLVAASGDVLMASGDIALPSGELPIGSGDKLIGSGDEIGLPSGELPLTSGDIPIGSGDILIGLPSGEMPMGSGDLPPFGLPSGEMPPMGLPSGEMPPMGFPSGEMPMGSGDMFMGLPSGDLPIGLASGELPMGSGEILMGSGDMTSGEREAFMMEDIAEQSRMIPSVQRVSAMANTLYHDGPVSETRLSKPWYQKKLMRRAKRQGRRMSLQ